MTDLEHTAITLSDEEWTRLALLRSRVRSAREVCAGCGDFARAGQLCAACQEWYDGAETMEQLEAERGFVDALTRPRTYALRTDIDPDCGF